MPPKKSNTLTEAELRLMKILWRARRVGGDRPGRGDAGRGGAGVQLGADDDPDP